MSVQAVLSKIEELREEVSNMAQSSRIWIAISTCNRYDTFKRCYDEVKRCAPPNSVIVVVDDASDKPVPEATFRFNQNVGIARAKNKCFELLYDEGCEHFFLFDDDCWPQREDWHVPYVESKEPHLNYIFGQFKALNAPKLNDTPILYKDSKIVAYSHARGCMCYYKRVCLEKVGGMHPVS